LTVGDILNGSKIKIMGYNPEKVPEIHVRGKGVKNWQSI
jgi:hypothetical protein